MTNYKFSIPEIGIGPKIKTMYPGNTHLKPVIGLDIHFVNIPFPCPLPHPYIGLVIDPFDYIPFIGATVKINGVPRGTTDTMGKIITFIHIPFGAGFTIPPIIGHDSQNFFGSKNVQADGAPLSGAGYLLMTCNDIGIPLSLSPGKKFIPIPSLYLPTSFCIPLQWGPPVMVGGPMVPHFSLLALLKGFAFGSFLKVFGKIAAKLLTKLSAVLKKFPASQKLSSALCKMGFEPVDLITGRVNYNSTDFEIPGPIPIKWSRNWDSDSRLKGPLGYKTHLCYDRYIQLFTEDEALVVLLADGRAAAFPLLQPGDDFYHPTEKITLSRKQNGHFLLEAHTESLYYHFNFHTAGTGIYKLSFIEDYSGFRVQLHYSGRHLSALTDAAGRRILCRLNRYGCITGVDIVHKQERKTLIQYSYNEQEDLSIITDALNQPTTVVYNSDHLMTAKTDRNGQSFYWTYDNKQRCTHTWGDNGIQEGRIAYHKGFTIVTNGEAEQTTYYHDENNLCIQETDHYGNSRFTEYTTAGQVYRVVDEEGNSTGYVYNESGELSAEVQPDGSAIQYDYNGHHQPILITYPDDTTKTYVYDEQHRLSFINYPNGHYNAYTYNEEGLIQEVNSRGGTKNILQYDEEANLQKMIFADGSQLEWQYDAFGRCSEAVDAEGKRKQLQYDDLNRLTGLHLPDGNRVKLQYNAYDEVVLAADKHSAVQFEYTPMGNLKRRMQNNMAVDFHYDSQERLTYISNEAGKIYRLSYNKRGEIIKETGFDGRENIYQRDKAGKTIKLLRPGGKSTLYEYDVNGRIVRTEYHDGSWEVFEYNKNGHLTGATNQFTTVTIKRNKLGLPEMEMQDGYSTNSSYDQSGNRTRIQSNMGADITITRNKTGQASLMHVVCVQAAEDLAWQAQYTYNRAGQEIKKLLPGALSSEKNYDQAGRPGAHKVSRDNVMRSWKKYTWDTNDHLTGIIDALAQGSTRFKHDGAGNLVWAQYADNSIVTRQADATGNLQETTADRRYSSAGALLESHTHSYRYDEEGNLVSKTEKATQKKTSYTWYATGMLQKVIRPDGRAVCFKYDALNRRTEKCFNGEVRRFVWDGNTILHEWTYKETDRPVAVVDEWGELQYNKPEPGLLTPHAVLENITWIFDADGFVPAAKIANGKTYSIISDYLGTPKEMYNAEGEKVWEGVLDIYGRVRTLTGSRNDLPYRFQGQYEDAETGLYYNRFRYYSPEEGIYNSQDPIGLQGGIKLYAYVNDSNFLVDIFGLEDGGSYGGVRGSNTGGQTNHMPANAASQNGGSGITHYSGPSTHMETGDHFQTASWGSRTTSREWRAAQEDLVSRGKFGKAMEMDIRDVTRKFGSKYDKGMRGMIDYSIGKEYITGAEGRRLKRKYLKCK